MMNYFGEVPPFSIVAETDVKQNNSLSQILQSECKKEFKKKNKGEGSKKMIHQCNFMQRKKEKEETSFSPNIISKMPTKSGRGWVRIIIQSEVPGIRERTLVYVRISRKVCGMRVSCQRQKYDLEGQKEQNIFYFFKKGEKVEEDSCESAFFQKCFG